MNKINFLKKIFLKFIGVYYKEYKSKIISIKKNINLGKIKFKYKNYDFSNIFNFKTKLISYQILNSENQCLAITKTLESIKPTVIFLHNVAYSSKAYIDYASKNNKISVCIGHGTLSKSHNRYSKIYQRIICDQIFSKKATYNNSQSKIITAGLNENIKKSNIIKSGNIIFAKYEKKTPKYILYAVTTKNFFNMQYYGQELYYEFFHNLKTLDKISKIYKKKIIVKLHPNLKNSVNDLNSYFTNLNFTNEKIDDLLKFSSMTISFSSNAIEDSLTGQVPVILFDPWKRYKHFNGQTNPNKIDQSLYYITNTDNLIKAIRTIERSQKINFNKYIYNGTIKKNISKLIDQISI